MANPQRGEVSLAIDGVERRMRLSLGALAALEARLEAGSLVALAERFEAGSIGATDVIAILAAGLEGAGEPVSEADLANADIAGGAAAAVRAAMALLTGAFAPAGQGPDA